MPRSRLHILAKKPSQREPIPTNLLAQPTMLIGRERDAEAICSLLDARGGSDVARLVTLVGPGGVGKTRLALQVAEEVLEEFPDGVYLIDLAPLSDPASVIPAIARTLDVRETPSTSLLSTLKEYLHNQRTLLVLDNFEQVIAAGQQLGELLASCPSLKLLVTSRSPLRLHAEWEFPVSPLALPVQGDPLGAGEISQYGAVALFVQRARTVRADFELRDSNAAAVVEICRRVDGLPLAIELVAAHTRLLPPQSILARLTHPLRLLVYGAQESPVRHKTMRETIEWSYNLLNEQEQGLFRRISVFVGGASLRATEAVCNITGDIAIDVDDPLAIEVLEGVEALLDKSLLHKSNMGTDVDPRLLMLETVREYALEQLVASGEAEIIRRRHADYFVALATQIKPDIESGDVPTWMPRLIPEHDNLRAALRWLLERDDPADNEAALQLILDLQGLWGRRHNTTEVQRWLETALTRLDGEVTLLRVQALRFAANTSYLRAEYERSQVWAEQALAAARMLKSDNLVADTLGLIGLLAIFRGEYEQARLVLEEALDIYRSIKNEFGVGVSYINLGEAMRYQGDYAQAEAYFRESLPIFRALERNGGVLQSLNNIGFAAYMQGNLPAARSVFLEGLALAVEIDARKQAAEVLTGMAGVLLAESGAESPLDLPMPGVSPQNLARVPAAERQEGVTEAVNLLGNASTIIEQSGRQLEPVEQAEFDRHVESARAMLGEEAFAKAWDEGRTMSLNQAHRLATREPAARHQGRGCAPKQTIGGLTSRESEVTALVAQGLSNEEIAGTLVLSERTVETHVSHALHKLGLSSRAQLTAWAIQNGIVPSASP
ncbi:MAG TPA: tetratricopeptide repeat protein [Chloroflexia bacterium]|nr:tetratricopeptide repeat protein [Chloroflexia bacterium]